MQTPGAHIESPGTVGGGPRSRAIRDIPLEPPCIMKTKYQDQLVDTPYLPKGEYYDIPYGCIVAKDIDNLLISGRCVSASHEAMSSLRVIATCFAIGEAAGMAAALSIIAR